MVPAAILSVLVKTQGAAAAAAELRGVDTAAKGANANLVRASGAAKSHGKTLSALGSAAKSTGALIGVGGLALGVKTAVSEFREAQKVGAQTNAVLKSTGNAANISKKGIENLANAIGRKSGIDDEAIQSAENLLLTFTKIRNETGKGNDIFNQATQAVTDMSAAMHQSGKASAIQLGKALQDPVKGATALRRVGVLLTTQQQDQIKAFVKTGNSMAAQKIILGELTREFGGSAASQATAADKMRFALGNLAESAGTILVPALDKAATALTALVTFFQDNSTAAKALGIAVGTVAGILVTYKVAMFAVSVATKAMAIATGAATAAQWALNAAMLANPFVAVVAGIVALNAALVVLYLKVRVVHNFINKYWPLLLGVLVSPFAGAVILISKHAGAIRNAVVGAFHAIIAAIKGMAGAITGLGAWTIARIVDGIHSAAGALLNVAGWIKDQIVRAMHALVSSPVALGSWFVHRFVDGITGAAKAAVDAVGGIAGKIIDKVKGIFGISSPSKVFEGIGRNMMKGLVNGMGATDVAKFVTKHLGGLVKSAAGLVGGLTTSGIPNASTGQIKGLGHQLAAGYGWQGGPQWAALDALWTQESGWNPRINSGGKVGAWDGIHAYGIPQALPPTKMGAKALAGDPGSQIAWGLGYIKKRYGSPLGALAHEKAHNWYARGGTVPGTGSGDSVLGMLTPGEFVMRKQVVDKFGPTFFAALNGYNKGGSVALANLVDSRFGLHMTSGYRTPQHNAAIGGAPNSWHTKGSPSNPGAVDLVGSMKNMRAALAWVKANVSGLAEAMIDNYAGLGWNLHIAGPGLMNFKGLSEGGGKGTRGTSKGKGNVVQIPPHTKKFLAQGREILAQKKAVKDYHARGGISAAQGFRKDTTINNPWLQAILTHIDNLIAAGQMTEAQGNATKIGYLQKALPSLTGENGLIAQGMIRSLSPGPAGDGFYSVVEDRLSEINAQVRAGDLTAEQGRAAQIQTIQDNLGNPDLTDRDRLELRGELRDLTTAMEDNAATIQAQTDAMNALKEEVKKNNDFAQGVTATQLGTTMRALADFMNGQIYGQYNNRSSTASSGGVARY